ncbi:unnamed protein product, partial [Adineta steineri]
MFTEFIPWNQIANNVLNIDYSNTHVKVQSDLTFHANSIEFLFRSNGKQFPDLFEKDLYFDING